MKRLALASILVSAGTYAACAVEDPPPVTATGGATMTGGTDQGGTSAATGGDTVQGGSAGSAQGGTPPQGGSAGAMAGTPSTGGTGGDGVQGGTGGDGVQGGTGGDGMQGGTGGDGMQGGTGGMAGGGMAGGGMAGSGGTTPAEPTIQELVNNLDGHLIITPCGDTPSTDDCAGGGWRSNAVDNGANHACTNGRLEAVIPFPIGGTPGTEYDVTMHFYGVMEPRQYSNVMRETTGATNRNGGMPTGWAEAAGNASVYSQGDNNYNTYEIFVYDENDTRVAQYFINSDSGTGHYTFITDYAKTITVIGGGEVRLRVFDANCRQIKNCGANGGSPCDSKARTVDVAAAMPQPTGMPMLQQPGLGQQPAHSGQWWLIDVTQVATKN